MFGQVRLECEQGAREFCRIELSHLLERPVAEEERRPETRNESVLGPPRLQCVRQRVPGGPGMPGVPEALAQCVVRIFKMLSDVADGLLGRRGTVLVPSGGDGLEGRDEATAKDVGEPHELHNDSVRRLSIGR